ncbi:MAG: hypothetical protein ABFS03_10385 [Chloroflexota bacterium]
MMTKKNIPTTETPNIVIIEVGGNLNLKGWDQTEVRFLANNGDGQIEELDQEIRINCPGNCMLRVPHSANIEIQQVGGQLHIKALEGNLNIGKVGANIVLKDVAAAQIENIGGQLSAKRIRGDLHVESIGGSAVVQDVDGQFAAKAVGGSLHLQQVSGGISARVDGNAVLRFSPVSWQAYDVDAVGRIRCQLPEDVSAMVNIVSGAQKIEINRFHEAEVIRAGEHILALGDGEAAVNFSAGGKVTIETDIPNIDFEKDFNIDFGAIGEFGTMAEEIAQNVGFQIEAQLGMLEEQLETQLSGLALSANLAGLSEEKARRIEEKMKRASERAAQRAEQAAERMKAKLERKLAYSQRKAARKAHGHRPHHARVETEPVSEAERMLILKMLEEDKISVEQADRLLSSLGE